VYISHSALRRRSVTDLQVAIIRCLSLSTSVGPLKGDIGVGYRDIGVGSSFVTWGPGDITRSCSRPEWQAHQEHARLLRGPDLAIGFLKGIGGPPGGEGSAGRPALRRVGRSWNGRGGLVIGLRRRGLWLR